MRHIEPDSGVERRVYQVPEAADMLGVSKDLIYKMVREKTIPCKRLGRRVVFPRDRFDKWMNEGD